MIIKALCIFVERKKSFLIITLLFSILLKSYSQTVIYRQDFETSWGNWTLNSGDLGSIPAGNGCNQWIVNNVYIGNPYGNTPFQPAEIINSPESNYLHIYSDSLANTGILNSNFNATCAPERYFAKMNSGVNTIGYTSIKFSFWWTCNLNKGIPELYYSNNGGVTWHPINHNFTGGNVWKKDSVILPAFVNQADLRFAFAFTYYPGEIHIPGFSIDEIEIIGCIKPSIISQPTDINACSGDSVAFSITATGTGNLNYQWKHNDIDIPGANQNVLIINPVKADDYGRYTCIVSNTCGTIISSQAYLITPRAEAGNDGILCKNVKSYSLNGKVYGTSTGIWSTTGTGTFSPNNQHLNATYYPSVDDYNNNSVYLILTTTDNGSCNADSDTLLLTFKNVPIVNAGSDKEFCSGNSVMIGGNPAATSGEPPYTYQWQPITYLDNPTSANTNASPPIPIQYILRVTDSNGCKNSDTVFLNVLPIPIANAGQDRIICRGESTILGGNPTGSGVNPVISYFWVPSTGLNNRFLSNPTASPTTTINYLVVITDNKGCEGFDDVTITVVEPPIVDAGNDKTICASDGQVNVTGTASGFGVTWTTSGTGHFSNPNDTSTIYFLSQSDKLLNSVTLYLTTDTTWCAPRKDSVKINILPLRIANAGNDLICCYNSSVQLNGSVQNATGGIWSGGSGTFTPSPTTLNAIYTPSITEKQNGYATLILTTTGNGGCPAGIDTVIITIPPLAVADAGPDKTVCANNANVTLTGTISGGATKGKWTTNGSGTFLPNDTSLTVTYIPSVADKLAGSVKITLTTTDHGMCTAGVDEMILTITPAPVVDAGTNFSICKNNPVFTLHGSVTGGASTGIWSTNGTGTFSNATSLDSCIYTPSPADLAAGSINITLTSTNNGLCLAEQETIQITFTPEPVVEAGNNVTVCANNAAVTLSGSITGGASQGIWTTSGTGYFYPNPTSLNATYHPSPDDTLNHSVILYLTSTNNGNCLAVRDSIIVTITPAPKAFAGNDVTVCANNSHVNLSGSVLIASGGTWNTSGSGTFTPNNNLLNATYIPSQADINAGNVTLTLTTTGNGNCLAVSDNLQITITPPPIVNAGNNQTVCKNNSTIQLNGSVSGATSTGIWTTNGTGTFLPSQNDLSTKYYPSASDLTGDSIVFTLTSTNNGNCLAVSDNVVIYLSPSPIVNAGPDRTICYNNPQLTLNATVTGGSNTGVWTSSGTGTFLPNNYSLNATYIPSQNDLNNGSFYLILTSTNNGNCLPVKDSIRVIVTPAPIVDAGPDQEVCAGNPNTNLIGSITMGATTGIWSTSGTGYFSPSSTNLTTTYYPSQTDIQNGSVIIKLTSTNNGNCLAVTDSMIIYIIPSPTVDAGNDITLCKNNPAANLNGTVTNATGGKWNTMGDGYFTPSDTLLNTTYIPGPNDINNGTVTLSLTTTGIAVCPQITDYLKITFTEAPYVNAGPDNTVCANNANISLGGIVSGPTTTGIWTTSGHGTFYPDNTTLNAIYINNPIDTVNPYIVLTLTSTNNGNCLAVSDELILNFTPAPVVNAGNDFSVCANNSTINLNGSVSVATTTGIWSVNGSGNFIPNNTSLTTQYIPSQADIIRGNLTFVLTSTNNGNCLPVRDTVKVTITPAPIVEAGPNQLKCQNNPNVSLNSASVSGATNTGQWTTSGTGYFLPNNNTVNATYIPSSADINNGVWLTLTSTNNGNCIAVSDSLRVNFTKTIYVNAGNDTTVCYNNALIYLNGSITGGTTTGMWTTSGTGTFSPNSLSLNGTYNPSVPDKLSGTVTLTLTSTNNGGCPPVSDKKIVTITQIPTINIGNDTSVCANNAHVPLHANIYSATGVIWSTNGDGFFTPSATSLNPVYHCGPNDTTIKIVTITATTTGNGACYPVNDTKIITITPGIYVNAGPDKYICKNNPEVNLNGIVAGGTNKGKWSSTGTGTFVPSDTILTTKYIPSAADIAHGSIKLILTSRNNGKCIAISDTLNVIFTPEPIVNAGNDLIKCGNNANVQLNGNVSGASTTGVWSSTGTGIFIPNTTTLNATYIPSHADTSIGFVSLILTSTNVGNCIPASDTINITITKPPVVKVMNDTSVCINNSIVPLTGSVSVGSTTGIWSSSGTGTFVPNPNVFNPEYHASQEDLDNGSVLITLTSTNNGNCLPVKDTLRIIYTPFPVVDAGPDQIVCANNANVYLNGSVTLGTTTGVWTSSGTGYFIPDATNLNATYIPSPEDTSNHNVILTLTSTNNGGCNPVSDNLQVTILESPIAYAGNDVTVCANNATVTLNGKVVRATGGYWTTTGDGYFFPSDSLLNTKYYPGPNDTAAHEVYLILHTTGNGLCNEVTDTLKVTITHSPYVYTGRNLYVCTNNPDFNVNAIIAGGASQGIWNTNGSGTFSPDNTSLNITYHPSPSDVINNNLYLTLTSTNNGNCLAVTDTLWVHFTDPPFVQILTADTILCANKDTLPIKGIVWGGTNTAGWVTYSDGVFLTDTFELNNIYVPGVQDTANGFAKVYLISTNNGGCLPAIDSLIITLTPAPWVNAGPDIFVCRNNAIVNINANIWGATTTGIWSYTGTGTLSPNVNSLNITYTPSNADTANGFVYLYLTSTNNGNCWPTTDTVYIQYTALPFIEAGNDQTVCANNAQVQLNGNISGGTTTGIWYSSGTGYFIPSPTNLNAVYIPSKEDTTLGQVKLILQSTNNGGCNPVFDTVNITITPAPKVFGGPDHIVCANNSMINLNGNFIISTGAEWHTTGDGYFTQPINSMHNSYQPGINEINNGISHIYLISTGNGLCNPVYDTVTITITPSPVVNAGSDQYLCANNPNVHLNGGVSVATTTGIWSTTGSGFFINNQNLNTTYIPDPIDIFNGQISIILTSTNNGNCNAVSDTMKVFFTPPPIVNAGVDQTVCSNNKFISLSGVISGATTTGKWTTNGNGIFIPSDTNVICQYQIAPSDTVLGTLTFTLSSTNHGNCNVVSDNLTVTFTTSPQINAGNDKQVCKNNTNVQLSSTFSVATGVKWSTTGSGYFVPSDTSAITSYHLGNNDNVGSQFWIYATTTGMGNCLPVTDSIKITVTVPPYSNAGDDQYICKNNPIVYLEGNISGATTTGIWTTTGTGTFNPSPTNLFTSYIPSNEDLNKDSITIYLTSTNNNNCLPDTDSIKIYFTPSPIVDAGPDRFICSCNEQIILNATISGGATEGIWISSTGFGQFYPSAFGLNTNYLVTPDDTTIRNIQLYLITTNHGNCLPVVDTVNITFTEAPAINAGPDMIFCANNANIQLNASYTIASGVEWNTSGSGQFVPSNTIPNPTYIHSSADENNGFVYLKANTIGVPDCAPVYDSLLVILTPRPIVDAGPDHYVCKNNPNVILYGTIAGGASNGRWSTSGTGNFFPGPESWSYAIYQPSQADLNNGKVTIYLTSTENGNCLPEKDSTTIYYTALPTVSVSNDVTVCANNSAVNISGTVGGGTTTGIWSSSGTGIFLPSPEHLNATYIPSAYDTSIGNVILTLTSTNNGGCNPVSASLKVTITVAPYVFIGNDTTLCQNNPNLELIGKVWGATTTGMWSTSGTGVFQYGNYSLNNTYLPSTTDIANGFVDIYLTSTNNGNCLPVTDTLHITFSNKPIVYAGTDTSLCSNNAQITLNGNISGGNFTGIWSTSGTGHFIPDETKLNAIYQASPADTANGYVILTLTSTNNGNCLPVKDSILITFTTSPAVNAGPDQTVGANNAATQLHGTYTIANGIVWNTLGDGYFTPSPNDPNAVYHPGPNDIANQHVTIVISTINNGNCLPAIDTMFIFITPSPNVNPGQNQWICRNNPIVQLNGQLGGTAVSAIWTTSGTGQFFPSDTILNAIYIPSPEDLTLDSIYLTLTTTNNGPNNPEHDSIWIYFTPEPIVNAGLDQTVCANNATIQLNGYIGGASNTGYWETLGSGYFLPSNINLNAIYIPSQQDTSNHFVQLVLHPTNIGNCLPVYDTLNITITGAPYVNAGQNITVCADTPSDTLNGFITGATTTGYWTTTGDGTFSPNNQTLNAIYTAGNNDISNGIVTLILTSTNNGNCLAVSDTTYFIITPKIFVNAGRNDTICANNPIIQLNGNIWGGTNTGYWSTTGSGTFVPTFDILNPSYIASNQDTLNGSVYLILTSTNNGGCQEVRDSILITITDAPVANAGENRIICSIDSLQNLNGSVTIASGGIWSTNTNGYFIPSSEILNTSYHLGSQDYQNGFAILILTTTGNDKCLPVSDTLKIFINEIAKVNAGEDLYICENNNDFYLNGNISGGTTYGHWTTNGTGIFYPSENILNPYYISSEADLQQGSLTFTLQSDSNGVCPVVKDEVVVIFTPAPSVYAGKDITICSNELQAQLNGSITMATNTGIWYSTGDGYFIPNSEILNPIYIPGPQDTTIGQVILVLTSTNNGNCLPVADSILINIQKAPQVYAGPDQVLASKKAQLNGFIKYAQGAKWSTNGTGYFTPNDSTLNAVYNLSSDDILKGKVILTLTTTGNGVCKPVSDEMIIYSILNIPNAFSPNDDGINDTFLEGIDITIINRWGQTLYKGNNGWDGTYKGQKVPAGTYYYIINSEIIGEENIKKAGSVTVINESVKQ